MGAALAKTKAENVEDAKTLVAGLAGTMLSKVGGGLIATIMTLLGGGAYVRRNLTRKEELARVKDTS